MTNFEKIRSMTDEQLTNFLASISDASTISPGYCDERCPYGSNCASCAVINCEVSDEMIIKEWGARESIN